MTVVCIVNGCTSSKQDGVTFHQFPKDPKYCKIWTERIRRMRPSWFGPCPSTKVCSAHFEPTQYHGYMYSMFGIKRALRLLPTAIPSYFPGGVYMAIEKELLPELTEIKTEGGSQDEVEEELTTETDVVKAKTEGIIEDRSKPVSAAEGKQNGEPSLQSGNNETNLDHQDQDKSLEDERNQYRLPPIFPAPNSNFSSDLQNSEDADKMSNEKNKSLTIVTRRMDENENSRLEKHTTNIWQQNRVSGKTSGQHIHNQQGQLIAIEPTVYLVSMVQMIQQVQPLSPPEVPKATDIITSGGSHPEVSQPECSQSEGSQLECSQLEGSQLEVSQLEGSQLEGSHLEGSHLEGSQTEVSQSIGSHSEGSQLGIYKHQSYQPESSRPESSHPESSRPESSHPESSHPDVFQPEVSQLEGFQPEGSQHDLQLENHQPKGSQHEDASALGTDHHHEQNLLPIETLEQCSDAQIDELLASVLSPIDKGNATHLRNDMLYIPESFVEGLTVKCESDLELSQTNAENGSDAKMPQDEEAIMEFEEIKEGVKIEEGEVEKEEVEEGEEEEDEEEEEEEEEEEDAWEMEDNSSDEDYIPDVKVKKRPREGKFQTRRASRKSDENKNEPQDGDDRTANGEHHDASESEDNMSSSDSEYTSTDDSDEIEKRERRAQKKKIGLHVNSRPSYIRLEVLLAKLPKMFECKNCLKKMKDPEEMKRHQAETHHKKPSTADKENQKAEKSCNSTVDIAEIATEMTFCKTCQEYVKDIRKHRIDHRRRTFVCDICGKVLFHKASFKVHLMGHNSTEKVYPCKICGRSYRSKGGLLTHYHTVHTNDNGGKQICEQCGKSFVSRKSLSIHKSVHLEEKPYKCDVCGRGFTQKSNMVLHMRVHTGVKPYKCDECGESFNHNISLKTHQKKAHGIDWWINNKNKNANTT